MSAKSAFYIKLIMARILKPEDNLPLLNCIWWITVL